MVDAGPEQTLSFEYMSFRGLNKRDDENHLPIGQTPDAQNNEIVKRTGLRKRFGFNPLYSDYDFGFNWDGATNYRLRNNQKYYLAVNYPSIFLINPTNGFETPIQSNYPSTGKPFFIPLTAGHMMIVDGNNNPRLVDNGVVTTVAWPPTYAHANSGRLDESSNATSSNPTTLGQDIWYPSFGCLYENRAWLAGDKLAPNRIYVSKILDFANFSDNASPTSFNIAFFVDVQTSSPITALKVVNNQYMVIYCERETLVLTGKFPPGNAYPAPYFNIDSLNPDVGCLSPFLIAEKGDNDHFFVANNGTIYTLQNTDNFQDIRPLGLSSKIFPLLQSLSNETLARGYLVNHRIKGELHFYFPSANNLRYPDQRLIYAYSDSDQEEEWSLDTGFGDFFLQSAFIDDESTELILLTSNNFLQSDSGLTYNGEPIELLYQLSTLDFGAPDNRKEIVNVTLYASSDVDTTVTLYSLNEDNTASFVNFDIPANIASRYDSAIFNTSRFAPYAGRAFSKVERQISNKFGKVFKFKLRHAEEANLFIHSIIFRYKILGK